MLAGTSRAAARSTRAFRVRQPVRARQPRTLRYQSTQSASSSSSSSTGAIAGGVAGGVTALIVGYSWYHFSGAKTVVNSVHKVNSYADEAFKKATEAAPKPNEAVKWLRDTVNSYAKFIPGAQQYVDSAFNDLDKVHEKHGQEVDDIIKETYGKLKDASKAGFSVAAATQAWNVLQDCLKRIGSLATDAAEDILEEHPQLKSKVGGNIQELKQMGEKYGPEAKKTVDETWKEVQDILKNGFSPDTVNKLQKLVQEKTQEVKKFGDQAWQKGIEQAQPILDKQPQLKELLEKNKDKLLQGDLGQLWQQLQQAVKSGDTDDLQKFVKDQADKVSKKAGGGGIEQFLQMIPGGQEIGPKLQQLQELSQKHGQEAEKLMKSALDDIKQVLNQKVKEGEQLKEKVEADAKR